MTELSWTGERLVTTLTDVHGVIEHLHRYALAVELVEGKTVLDIASGEGYGSFLLSKAAKKVYGVDISPESVTHASTKYKANNLEFKVGSTSCIPLPNNSVDVVVSFETIEHHNEHEQMMEEIRRVLTPNGILFISSPEKSIYKERDPDNPYHIKELALDEFKNLLKGYFSSVKIFDQRFVFGSMINDINNPSGFSFFDGDYNSVSKQLNEDRFYNRAFFNLALASDQPQESVIPGTSFFNGLKVLLKQLDQANKESSYYRNEVLDIKNSWAYKTGFLIIKPFSLIKTFLKK